MSTEAGPSAQVQQDHGMQEDELLHDEELLDLDEDFEEGLRELGLLHEFATGVIDSAAQHPAGEQAVAAAAELAVALGATGKPLSRQQLAAESYKSAQKGFQARSTSQKRLDWRLAQWKLEKGDVQAWCDKARCASTLSDETIELYCRFVCKEQLVGRGQGRSTSFKYAAQHILALRDLRLQQLSEGLYNPREVWPSGRHAK